MDRKQTAWKKSRKFGNIYSGREYPKMTDQIFRRAHSILLPSPLETPATHGIVEEYTNQYAFERTSNRRLTYSHPSKSTVES